MSESGDIKKVLASLRKVPPKHLLIIDLANRITLKDGVPDCEEVADIQPEVNLAIAEAKTYGAYTLVAVNTLKNLGDREEDV